MVRICNHEACEKQANFNLKGEKYGILCGTHKADGMLNVRAKTCLNAECPKIPTYNTKDNTTPIYCGDHKLIGMVRVGKIVCIEEGCNSSSSFNVIGEKRPIYCKSHRKDEMIDVAHPRCLEDGCELRPSCNLAGFKKALYCVLHKKDTMINVVSNRCVIDCKSLATFGISGETVPTHCKKHIVVGMVDISHRKCAHESCMVRPNYNMPGEKRGLFCVQHRSEFMIDVECKTCIFENCNKQPRYNVAGIRSGLYCIHHKMNNMVDVVARYCSFDGCEILHPSFNYEAIKKGIFCATHRLQDMVDVNRKKCATHLCDSRLRDNKYENYCFRCYINTYPERPITRNYKTRERNVVDNVKSVFPDFDWISDKIIQDGCSRRRPDLLLDLGFQVIIIEIDEYAHSTYDSLCEARRVDQISQDLYNRNIIFIRFNPDSYVDSLGKKIPSCWSTNKLGLMVVSKIQEKKWKNRIDTLINQIHFCVDNPTEKKIDTIELFY